MKLLNNFFFIFPLLFCNSPQSHRLRILHLWRVATDKLSYLVLIDSRVKHVWSGMVRNCNRCFGCRSMVRWVVTWYVKPVGAIQESPAPQRGGFSDAIGIGGTARWPFPTNSRRTIPKRRGRRPRRPIRRNAAFISDAVGITGRVNAPPLHWYAPVGNGYGRSAVQRNNYHPPPANPHHPPPIRRGDCSSAENL